MNKNNLIWSIIILALLAGGVVYSGYFNSLCDTFPVKCSQLKTSVALTRTAQTPTRTATGSPTAGATTTLTLTATPSATQTATAVSTATATNTATVLASATKTNTPTVTRTITQTKTNTPTNTKTATATKTLIVTATNTATSVPSLSVKFAVIGDYGLAGTNEQNVANLVKSWNPDFIVTAGDNNYPDGAASTIPQNITQYYGSFVDAGIFWPSPGNHDWGFSLVPYKDYFNLPNNERYYKITQGPIDFFILDSDSHEPDGNSASSVQHTWFVNELAKSTAIWKIVVYHHTAYTSGTNHGSNTTMQGWKFENSGVQLILQGHEHVYERVIKGNSIYITDGLGGDSRYACGTLIVGSQKCYDSDYGAVLITATNNQLTGDFYNWKNVQIDHWTQTP